MKFLKTIPLICTCALFSQTFNPIQTQAEIQMNLNFLTAPTSQVGFTYQGTVGSLSGLTFPLSYYSTAEYWGEYVGGITGNDLTVVDVYNPGDYTLSPSPTSPGKDLQIERVNTNYGTDIYDAACWQVALAVAGKGGMKGPSGSDLFKIAENQDVLLLVGYDGNAPQIQANANRATTRGDGTFSYNGEHITTPANAYFFRMVTRNWLSVDPFMGTSYMKYVTATGLPPNPQYAVGKITWQDWKPITGENAWAFFIGPLQTAYLKMQSEGNVYVPFQTPAVQNALGALYALRCMQSEEGGIYYACKGSLGNQGDQPVDPYEVSVENNASALGGIMIFQKVLQDELANETDLTAEQKSQIQTTLSEIDAMIHGGQTPQGETTKGLLSFFQHDAWDSDSGIFYQGGEANNPSSGVDWKPTREPKAVDVNTWGVSVLGQPLVDEWFGFGAAYQIWENVKSWGGYFTDTGMLFGVGYSDEDGNGASGKHEGGIVSAEWTAGAINMLRCLIVQYTAASTNPKYSLADRHHAVGYVQELQKDHDSMMRGLLTLRCDNYPSQSIYSKVVPFGWSTMIPIPNDKLAFVYASKRYMIPFGWFANPLPSTTSTSWAMMLHFNFNPFHVGGDYTPVLNPS